MTCRDIESLILAERDGALPPAECAALSDHVAACPACRELRTRLAVSLETFQAGVAGVPVPDADEAWRELQAKIRAPAGRAKKRPLAPIIWFATPLAAAAAVAFAFLVTRPAQPPSPAVAAVAVSEVPPPPPPPPAFVPHASSAPYDPSIIAGADYVEAGDPNASTMVYVDKESGWLVVWATNEDAAPARG
jgi:anti-sigma factor RsiW